MEDQAAISGGIRSDPLREDLKRSRMKVLYLFYPTEESEDSNELLSASADSLRTKAQRAKRQRV